MSPSFLVSKFCRNIQIPKCFGEIILNSAKTVRFDKTFTPGNYVKFRFFPQRNIRNYAAFTKLPKIETLEKNVTYVQH